MTIDMSEHGQLVELDEKPDNPGHLVDLAEDAVAKLLGFRIRPSGNISGPYSCDLLDVENNVRSTGPAQEREIMLWRFAVAQAAGYWASNGAQEVVEQQKRNLEQRLEASTAREAALEQDLIRKDGKV